MATINMKHMEPYHPPPPKKKEERKPFCPKCWQLAYPKPLFFQSVNVCVCMRAHVRMCVCVCVYETDGMNWNYSDMTSFISIHSICIPLYKVWGHGTAGAKCRCCLPSRGCWHHQDNSTFSLLQACPAYWCWVGAQLSDLPTRLHCSDLSP